MVIKIPFTLASSRPSNTDPYKPSLTRSRTLHSATAKLLVTSVSTMSCPGNAVSAPMSMTTRPAWRISCARRQDRGARLGTDGPTSTTCPHPNQLAAAATRRVSNGNSQTQIKKQTMLRVLANADDKDESNMADLKSAPGEMVQLVPSTDDSVATLNGFE